MTTDDKAYDLLMLGQGASAFSAALYAARYQMKVAMFGAQFGGETSVGGVIENYPGAPRVDGFDLMLKMKEQVDEHEVPIIPHDVTQIRKDND